MKRVDLTWQAREPLPTRIGVCYRFGIMPRGVKGSATPSAGRTKRKPRDPADVVKGRVRPHDPFELIRWVAFSQTDPRKALAELVQNSLDALAARIAVTRLRHKGVLCLRIYDDGQGVIPELDRPEALKYIATHIGHSRKRSLSPQERLALMTQGQYGIGLLGFWCVGDALEMRSSVPGQKPHRLILHRDRPDYRIEPLRGRLGLDERWTEILVSHLHPEAARLLAASRAADYLAAELRGQLLSRKVDLIIEDRIARGRARKHIPVRPRRFLGERLAELDTIAVPGRPPIRLEIYYRGDASQNDGESIAVYAAGTLVAETVGELTALDMNRAPWNDTRLSGLIDYPGFNVAPGTRRGVIPDDAAEAFVRALKPAESRLNEILAGYERRRAEELDRTLIKDLQRAFRDFYRQRPAYAMLPVRGDNDLGTGPSGPGAEGPAHGLGNGVGNGLPGDEPSPTGTTPDNAQAIDGSIEAEAARAAGAESEALPMGEALPAAEHLFPPGPLDRVQLTPSRLLVERGARRRVRAIALDGTGRPAGEEIAFDWSLVGPVGTLVEIARGHGPVEIATLLAAGSPAEGYVKVTARSDGRACDAAIPVEVVEHLPGRGSAEGIPKPELLDQPAETWRSRMTAGRWQVNAGHRDYRAVAEQPRLKLRYLAMLFAKEVVLRNHQDPRLEQPLEQLVEVMSYADQRISGTTGPGARKGPGKPEA